MNQCPFPNGNDLNSKLRMTYTQRGFSEPLANSSSLRTLNNVCLFLFAERSAAVLPDAGQLFGLFFLMCDAADKERHLRIERGAKTNNIN